MKLYDIRISKREHLDLLYEDKSFIVVSGDIYNVDDLIKFYDVDDNQLDDYLWKIVYVESDKKGIEKGYSVCAVEPCSLIEKDRYAKNNNYRVGSIDNVPCDSRTDVTWCETTTLGK